MIIHTDKIQEGTTLTKDKDDFVLNHVVNIDPVLKANYEARKDSQNGFSKDKSYRRVASIPFETWIALTRRLPELVLGDKELREKTLDTWLKSEEAKMFWTVNKGI